MYSPNWAFSTEDACKTTTTLCLGKFASPSSSNNIARRFCPFQVRRQRADDDCVWRIVPNNHMRMGVVRRYLVCFVWRNPEDIALLDSHPRSSYFVACERWDSLSSNCFLIQRIRLIALCSGMKHAPTVSENGTGKRKPSTSYHNAPSVQYANFAVLFTTRSFIFILYLSAEIASVASAPSQ